LNEHILGQVWPPAARRIAMLEEALEVMRKLWTGELITHRGEFYSVDTARLYTLPEEPPRVYMSALGPNATSLAALAGDGCILAVPSSRTVEMCPSRGGPAKPILVGIRVCWGGHEGAARRLARVRWPTEALVGEALQ